MNHDELLRDAQVAELLNISAGTLRSWRSRGRGPVYIRFSRKAPRYRLSDVLARIESRRVVPHTER